MTDESSGTRPGWIAGIALAVIIAVAVVLWLSVEGPGPTDPDEPGSAMPGSSAEPTPEASPVPAAPVVPAPAVQIADKGRLTVSRNDLWDGSVLALGLAMPDDVRGDGPRAVKVIDVDGRVLELEGEPVDGSGSGLRVEIDPEWLRPGRYLIQVKTGGPSPLPLRRYVLEVSGDEPTDAGSEAPTDGS